MECTDSIDGGLGNDTLALTAGGTFNMTTVDVTGIETVTVDDNATTLVLNDTSMSVTAGNGGNTITFGNGAQAVVSGSGNDSFTIDTTDTWNGSDSVDGGTGDDTVTFTGAGAGNYALGGFDNINNIIMSAAAMTVTLDNDGYSVTMGNAAQSLTTGTGADTITLVDNNMTVDTGGGNDVINVDATHTFNASDNIGGGAGEDTVSISGSGTIDFTAGTMNGVESIILPDDDVTITLDDDGYAVTMGDGAQSVALGLGDDTITMDAAINNVTILGGSGDDSIIYDSGNTWTASDSVDGEAGLDTMSITGGGTIDFTLGTFANVEEIILSNENYNLTLGNGVINVTMGNSDQIINAGSGGNIIRLGNGNMTVNTSGGSDRIDIDASAIVWDANDSVDGGIGEDTVSLSGAGTIDFTLGTFVNVEVARFTDGDNTSVTLTDDVVTVTGGTGNDTVTTGDANMVINMDNGNDFVRAGDGDDTIALDATVGPSGADTVIGGLGADSITMGSDSSVDIVRFETSLDGAAAGANTGFDTVIGFEGGTDVIQFAGDFRAVGSVNIDDVTADDSIAFFVEGTDTVALDFTESGGGGTKFEAYIDIVTGFTNADLVEASFTTIRAAVNGVGITSVAGTDAILILEGATQTGVYYYLESGTNVNQIDAGEITLLAIINSSTLTDSDFDLL